MRGMRKKSVVGLIWFLAIAMVLTGCSAGDNGPMPSQPPMATGSVALQQADFLDQTDFDEPSHGITVTGAQALSERAVEVGVSTDAVAEGLPGGQNSVIIVKPQNYDPGTHYRVVYLLGGSGAETSPARQWFEAGHAEQITDGLPVITVIPSGGKDGWYTDWTASGDQAQRWETYHLEQLVPWVDAHLPTRTGREDRVVLGNSMGGYGAIRYAEQHPDLFAEAISLSGLLDLSSDEVRDLFGQVSQETTGQTDAIFGNGQRTTDEQWDAHDPVSQSKGLERTNVQLFVGEGNGSSGDLEPTLRETTESLARALQSQGSPFSYTMYGRPTGCNGEHTFECWRPAATVALSRWADRLGIERSVAAQPVAPEFEDITSGEGS